MKTSRRRAFPILFAWFIGAFWAVSAAAEDDVAGVDPASYHLEIASPDRAFSMRFSLTAQMWVVVDDRGVVGDVRDRAAVIQLRRIRPVIKGNAFTTRFRYLLHISVLPGAFEMMDLTGDYRLSDRVHVRFGQWKIPYTRHRIRSYKHRQLVDWSIVGTYFGGERQVGVCFHDGYDAAAPPRLEWAVGVFDGANKRASHAIGPTLLLAGDGDDERRSGQIHPEIVARLAYNHGGIVTTGEGDLEGSGPGGKGVRFSVGLNGAWDLDPVYGEDWAIRGAAEALFKVRGFSLAGTFYVATLQDGPQLSDQVPGAIGVWAGTGFVIRKRVEIAGQYALVDPIAIGTALHEARGGVNVFILGRRVQWRTDAGVVLGTEGGDTTTDVQVRSIIQMEL